MATAIDMSGRTGPYRNREIMRNKSIIANMLVNPVIERGANNESKLCLCKHCPAHFSKIKEAEDHYYSQHAPNAPLHREKHLFCGNCDKSFKRYTSLSNHTCDTRNSLYGSYAFFILKGDLLKLALAVLERLQAVRADATLSYVVNNFERAWREIVHSS